MSSSVNRVLISEAVMCGGCSLSNGYSHLHFPLILFKSC